MNVLLREHKVKHVYKVPEGLRELCTDIAREVLRSQPRNIYCFVADYAEALLITRENAKVAVKVVNNILLGSQDIVDVLRRSGLSLEQIARAAPRIQAAFRAYLDTVDTRAAQVCDDATCDERSKAPLQSILTTTDVPLNQKKQAAIIQAAFRGYYEKMLLNKPRDIIQWQRPSARILEILRKTGASQAEASKAAVLIQATYRGYYTRRNLRIVQPQEEEKGNKVDVIKPAKADPAVTWLNTMYVESGLTSMRANEAASIIQKAYRRYRQKKEDSNFLIKNEESRLMKENEAASIIQKAYRRYRQKKEDSNFLIKNEESRLMKENKAASIIQKAYRRYLQKRYDSGLPIDKIEQDQLKPTRSMMIEYILNNLHQKIFDEVMSQVEIPAEFSNQENLTEIDKTLERIFIRDRLSRTFLTEEEYEEEESDESLEELDNRMHSTGMAKDWQEGKKIEVKPKRDEETNTYVED